MNNQAVGKIINDELDILLNDIFESLYKNNRVATGKTAKSLKVVMDIKADIIKGTLLGSSVLEQLEYGRGKTKNGTRGNSEWFKDLLNWVRLKTDKPDGFAYYLFKRINEEGYKGTPGLISNPIDKFRSRISKRLKAEVIKDFKRNGVNGNR